jgi:voltage-gated potassium channel
MPRSQGRLLDGHWLRSLGFTLVLVGLIAVAVGEDWQFTVSALATCAVGFGFFYLLFPGGLHFGVVVANLLAMYAGLFVFFHDANFHAASRRISIISMALPVAGFLAGCFLRRRAITGVIHARRTRPHEHLPRLRRWVPGTLAVGTVSFAVPVFGLGANAQGLALLASMTVIAMFVFAAARDVVLLQMDIALIFESVTARVHRLVMPLVAFLTVYALLLVVFACLFRIAERSTGQPQLALHGTPIHASFTDALYFSVITLSTVGYGDISPVGPLARALAAFEVVTGLLLLLFGFGEIMRSADQDRRGPPTSPPAS